MKIIENPPLAQDVERKLPFFIDIFLYPLTISGLVNMGIIFFAPFLIGIAARFLLWFFFVGPVIILFLYALYVGYVLYYLRLCVIDSSKGHLRAADIQYWQWPDKSDLLSQFLMVLASIAVCFCPAALFFILTEQTDIIFWFLLGLGLFFFPMSFLMVCLFDSVDSLNPFSIIKSIYNTFLPYLPLVVPFCLLTLICHFLLPALPRWRNAANDYSVLEGILRYLAIFIHYLVSFRFVGRMVVLFYLTMIAAHLLGRFYWLRKHELKWGL